MNRLSGKVTFTAAASRVVKISGEYLPMTTAAYAHNATSSRVADVADVTAYGDTHKKAGSNITFCKRFVKPV